MTCPSRVSHASFVFGEFYHWKTLLLLPEYTGVCHFSYLCPLNRLLSLWWCLYQICSSGSSWHPPEGSSDWFPRSAGSPDHAHSQPAPRHAAVPGHPPRSENLCLMDILLGEVWTSIFCLFMLWMLSRTHVLATYVMGWDHTWEELLNYKEQGIRAEVNTHVSGAFAPYFLVISSHLP